MFGKRKTPGQDDSTSQTGEHSSEGGDAATAQAEGPAGRQATRRALDPIGAPSRRAEARAAPAGANEGRKLVVGREISLTGEINKCEKLVVEGEVEADLKDCLSLEIADSGLFRGAAVVEEAEISGRFEGELTARSRLYVRATGRVNGKIRYADLEIERGGRIAGTVDVMDGERAEAEAEEEDAAEADQPEAGKESEASAPGSASASSGNGDARAAGGGGAPDQRRLQLDR